MANLANSRMTFGAVLGAIQTSAFAVSSSVEGIGNTAGMFNAAVKNAAVKQSIRHKIDIGTYEKTYSREKALEVFQLEQKIQKEFNSEADIASFNKIHDELLALLK